MFNEVCDYCGCPCESWYVDEAGFIICRDCHETYFPYESDDFWYGREVKDDYYEDTYVL